MWIMLLFISQVGCEWVQISQQHYRKPYRPIHAHPALAEEADLHFEEETTPETNRIYINQTMHGYTLKDTELPHKNKGFITQVEADDDHFIRSDGKNSINKEAQKKHILKDFNVEYGDDEDTTDDYAFKFTNNRQHTPNDKPTNDKAVKNAEVGHKTQGATSHDIPIRYGPDVPESQENVFQESYLMPNSGSIKRVHLDSRTVRTPILKGSNPHNIKPSISENYDVKSNTFPSRPVIIWKNENQTKKVLPGIIQKVSKEDLDPNPVGNNSRYEETTLITKDHTKNKNIFMTHVVQSSEGISGERVMLNQVPDINFEKPVFVTKEEFEDEGLVTISSETADFEEITESNKKSTIETPKTNINQGKDKLHETKVNNKVNTMENVLKFMRIVTDTISRNTRRTVGSKVRYLENLQDTIMTNIKHRIDSIWPDDTEGKADQPSSRKVRSAASPRGGGHVEFPSSESALMTISFLTFAVYLIKLVLQLIHTYKNKAMMMMAPAVVTTVGRTVTALYRRSDAN